jgi:hypothetical protein
MFFPKILHVVGVVIAKNSGAVTSMPNTSPIIFEVRRGSPLPELLAECGYDVSEAALKCRSCKKGRYAPPVHMIKLTQAREIAAYAWVHPDDDDRR